MKKRQLALVAIIIVAAMLAAPAWNFQQDKKSISAVIIKVKNEVERKTPTTGWTKALTLTELRSGHEVRTHEKSLAIVRFSDESKITVREKSILTVQGEVEGRRILNRNVYIERGRAVFDIKKQETEQFRFTSPISVASIRGTSGGTGFEPSQNLADITLITGTAEFTSTVTQCQTIVNAGQTGIIDSAGSCSTVPASQNQLNNNDPNSNINQGIEPEGGEGEGGTGERHTSGGQFTLNTSLSGTLRSGQPASIRVAIANPPVEITQATFHYRVQGEPSFKSLALTISGLNLSGTISAADIRAGAHRTFEYWFSMRGSDNSTYTFPPETPEANPYTLPVTPRTVRIKVPVVDPSGAQRYLEISYEE